MNPSLIVYGMAFLMVVGIFTGLYFHGKHVAVLEGRIVTAKVVSDIGAKQNEILLNGPDNAALLDSLRRGLY